MTSTIKKILCPLDFSTVSENALSYAFQLADIFDAEIHLMHVIEPATEVVMEIPHTMPVIDKKSLDATREQLKHFSEKVLTRVADKLKNTPVLFSEIEIGARGLTINHQAKEQSVDLIIMGTHDEENKSWWLSSVASEVLNSPSIPVLIIPEEAEFESVERISFASNLRRGDFMHLLKTIDFLKPLNPEYRCIHVVENEKEKTEINMEELIDAFSHQIEDTNITFHQLEEDDITEGLEAFNLIYHVDLQVMVKAKRNFFQALFHRSQSKKMATYTHIPLLILPE